MWKSSENGRFKNEIIMSVNYQKWIRVDKLKGQCVIQREKKKYARQLYMNIESEWTINNGANDAFQTHKYTYASPKLIWTIFYQRETLNRAKNPKLIHKNMNRVQITRTIFTLHSFSDIRKQEKSINRLTEHAIMHATRVGEDRNNV